MRLGQLFFLSIAVILALTLLPAGYIVYSAWTDDLRASRASTALETFTYVLKAAEKVSLERGPTNGLMGAPIADDPDWRARLTKARADTDAAFSGLDMELATAPIADGGAARELIAAIIADLADNRRDIDRIGALPNAQRDPAAIRDVVARMVALVTALGPLMSETQLAVGQADADLIEITTIARSAADLREFAGQLGSVFAAPMGRGIPFITDESLALARQRERVTLLAQQLEQAVAGARVDRISSVAAGMRQTYLVDAIDLVDRIGAAGRSDGHYPVTSTQFINTYVPAMATIIQVRDAALAEAAALAAEHRSHAHAVFMFAAAQIVVVLLLVAGLGYFQRTKVVRPLLRLATAIRTAGTGGVMVAAEAERSDEMGELARAVVEAKRQAAENERLRERIEADRASLARSLAEQRTVYETSPHGIALVRDRKFVSCNHACEAIFGFGPGELVGQSTRVTFDSDEAFELFGKAIYTGTRGGKTAALEYEALTKTGERRWVRNSLAAILADDPDAGYIAILEDITEQRQAGRALAEAEERFRLILGAASEGILGMDLNGLVTFINRAGTEMLGYSEAEMLGGPLHAKIHYAYPDGSFYPREVCPMFSSTHDGIERTVGGEVFWRKDGGSVPVEYSTSPISKDGRFVGTVVAFHDVSERLQAEAALREAKERAELALAEQRTVYETSPHGIALLKGRGVVSCNRACEAIFGYEPGEMVGLPTRAIYPSDEDFQRHGAEIYAALGRGETATTEIQAVRKSGEPIWISISLAAIFRGDAGSGVIAALEDITERRRAEEQLREAFEVIASSIRYASRIQRTVLPEPGLVQAHFPDHFILWEPRDVVSGDIYWCVEWGGGVLLALGDCTGHGVPGAFITMIASGAFERARADIPPGRIARLVQRMHYLIQVTMKQHLEEGESDDGMDLGLCFLPAEADHLTFVGARFSLFQGGAAGEWQEIKGDRRGLGYRGLPLNESYTEHTIPIAPGMRLYMSSDGLLDQIGGERRRAFGKARFLEVLGSVAGRPMPEQKEAIQAALRAYQGDEARRDDVSVIGFRL